MHLLYNKQLWALTGVLACVGCAGPSRQVRLDPRHIPQSTPAAYDDQALAVVLRDQVNQGQVLYARLAQQREPLERYLGLISVVGPRSTPGLFPGPADRTCYYINAYNACALHTVLETYPTSTVHVLALPFDYGNRFQVDKRQVALGELRELALAESQGDPRTLFCLSSAAVGSPGLASEPFRPKRLEEQLNASLSAGILNPHLVGVDSDRRVVSLWYEIVDHREAFIALATHSRGSGITNLVDALAQLAGGNAQRKLASASEYTVLRMPFDGRLNDVPMPAFTAVGRGG